MRPARSSTTTLRTASRSEPSRTERSPRSSKGAQSIALLVTVSLGTTACPKNDDDDASPTPTGEIAVADFYTRKIGLVDSVLYRNVTSDVRSLDVSAPSSPVDGPEVDAGLSCGLDCDAFVVDRSDGAGYLLDADEVSKVGLPDSVDWIVPLPEPTTYIPHDLATISGPGVAVSRYFFDPPTISTSGDIVLIDAAGTFQDRIYTDFLPIGLAADGGPLLTFATATASSATNHVIVYDVSSLASASEIARFPIGLPGTLVLDRIAVSGTNLAVTSVGDGLGDVGCFVAWYRFTSDFSSLTFVGSSQRYVPRIGSTPRFHGGMLFAGVSQDCGEPSGSARSTAVLAIGTGAELVEVARIGARSFPYALEIDETRDLLFVGGDVLQIIDLDAAIP